jgi:LysM repeat protein
MILLMATVMVAGGLWLIGWKNQNKIRIDMDLARSLITQNRIDEAELLLDEMLKQSRGGGSAWIEEALNLRLDAAERTGDINILTSVANTVLKDGPKKSILPGKQLWIRCTMVMGNVSLKGQDASNAEKFFESIIEHTGSTTPEHDEAILELARISLNNGDFDEGIRQLKELVSTLPLTSPLKLKAELVLGKANMMLLLQNEPYTTQIPHHVETGDTLEKLCLKYRTNPETIQDNNPHIDLDQPLPGGETIQMPVSDTFYKVKSGDTIIALSKRFGVSSDLIMHVNQIANPRHLRIGRRIKIPNLKLNMVVNKTDNTLTLFNHDQFLKKYLVRTGKNDRLTPTGNFKILNKIKDPEWTNPRTNERFGPGEEGNELGSRWMGFEGRSLGLHQALDPGTIGTYSSFGCVGLVHADIEELFNLIPIGTPIEITGISRPLRKKDG